MKNPGYNLCIDVEALKKRLKPLQMSPIKNGDEFINPFRNQQLKNTLKKVGELYGVKKIVITRDEDRNDKCRVGGRYSNKKITILMDKYRLPKLSQIISTFCHELAHHVQQQVFDEYLEYLKDYMPHIIVYERTAEVFAYHIYKSHFDSWQILSRQCFNTYNNKKDLTWLIQYHNNELEENNNVLSKKRENKRGRTRNSKKTSKS